MGTGIRRKSLESAFAAEFNQYVRYKETLLENRGLASNDRVKQLLDNMPPEMRAAAVPFLQKQLAELQGRPQQFNAANVGKQLLTSLYAALADEYKLNSTQRLMQEESTADAGVQDNFVPFLESVLPPNFQVYRGEYNDICEIRGVTEEYFSEFNKTTVTLQPRMAYKKAVVGNDGHLLINSVTNTYSTVDVNIPQGSRTVIASSLVTIPTTITVHGRQMPYTPPEGYGFIAAVADYSLYALLMTTEPLTGNKEAVPIKQYEFSCDSSSCIAYLYIVPYTGKVYGRNSILFAVRQDIDYLPIVIAVEEHWRASGFNFAVTRDVLTDRMAAYDNDKNKALFHAVEKAKVQPLYYFPREHIWRKNMCALMLSRKRLTSRYYWGRRYIFNKGINSAYLYVVPFTKNLLNGNNVIFCVKPSNNYTEEIRQLEAYWRRTMDSAGNPCSAVLYQVKDTEGASSEDMLEDAENNLSYKTLPIPDYAPFDPIGNSLADDNADLQADVMSDEDATF